MEEPTNTISRRRLIGFSAGLVACAWLGKDVTSSARAQEAPHWDYHSHDGADGWGHLTLGGTDQEAFPDCNLAQQSPVNIPLDAPLSNGLGLDYHPTPLAILNNGHTIQVNYEAHSSMTVGGKTYNLLQFHFHAPSEHEIDGEQTAMEGHLVHQSDDGEYAVLGIMIVPGSHYATFQKVLDHMPEEECEVVAGDDVDVSGLLPADLSYWAYDGSFTTPPCTEGVKWHVLYEPVDFSLQQIAAFRSLPFLRHDGEFFGNARPVQPLNGRLDAPAPMGEEEEEHEGMGAVITPPSTGSAGLR